MKLGWLDWLLLLTLSVLTFEKLSWSTSVVTLTWTNLLAVAFVVAFVVDRVHRSDTLLHPAAITLAGFMIAFAAVYLAGYYDLTDKAALQYWLKGLGTWAIHFTYLILGVAHMVRRGRRLYLRAIYAFTAGMVVNCVYGILQLGLQIAAGINLDQVVVGRLTSGQGGIGGINVYGTVGGIAEHLPHQRAHRRSEPSRRDAVRAAHAAPALLPGQPPRPPADRRAAALPVRRPGADAVALGRARRSRGLVVLLPHLRRFLPRLRTLAVGAGAVLVAFGLLYASSHFVRAVIASRTQVSGGGTQTHLQFYQLVPPALDPHPLFGMGFNTFAVFYQFVTGSSDFGPHSAWIAILVETGMVGMAVYLAYFGYLLASAAAIRRPPTRTSAGSATGLLAAHRRQRPPANFFYLTMTFDYFFAVALLAVAGAACSRRPASRRSAGRRRTGGTTGT